MQILYQVHDAGLQIGSLQCCQRRQAEKVRQFQQQSQEMLAPKHCAGFCAILKPLHAKIGSATLQYCYVRLMGSIQPKLSLGTADRCQGACPTSVQRCAAASGTLVDSITVQVKTDFKGI